MHKLSAKSHLDVNGLLKFAVSKMMALLLKICIKHLAMESIPEKAYSKIIEELGAWATVGLFFFIAVKLIESIF